jgi:tRNA-2-methylthio-N6-dimethylallyladenosine synthase
MLAWWRFPARRSGVDGIDRRKPQRSRGLTEKVPERKKVFIKTFGCQMNVYDSGKMQALLGKDGYESVDSPEEADLVLVNTCSVRDKPEQKLDRKSTRLNSSH